LSKRERETILVMFGDHLPRLGPEFLVYQELDYFNPTSTETWPKVKHLYMYTTPLVIWNNKSNSLHSKYLLGQDLPIGTNCLGSLIPKLAGISSSAFFGYVRHLCESQGCIQVDNNIEAIEAYKDYYTLTFNRLFGDNYLEAMEPETMRSEM